MIRKFGKNQFTKTEENQKILYNDRMDLIGLIKMNIQMKEEKLKRIIKERIWPF